MVGVVSGLPVTLRPALPTDRGFVVDSWLRSYAGSPMAELAGRAYWTGHKRVVERILAEGAPVHVACSIDDPGTLFGWACKGDALHYVYVKREFRRFGLARSLLRGMTGAVVYSHRTTLCSSLPIPAAWSYDPYAALEPG